jgi:uncharacterized protein YcbK (DUF882 family)
MALADAQTRFLSKLEQFWQIMAYIGAPVEFHEYYRSPQRQNELYFQGKTKAKGGQSSHNWGLAVDFHFERHGWNVPKDWWEMADMVARYVGLESGAGYQDANHIQLPGWKQWTT